MKTLSLAVAVLGLMAIVEAPTAEAGLILTLNQSTYQIDLPGSIAVDVYVSQTPGGPQVGPGNELLTGAILVTFDNPSGIAAVQSPSDITPGSAWDASSASVSSTTASLALTSVLGIADLSNPVLLGTFLFTGLAQGVTSITVAPLDPKSADFITKQGDVLDPATDTGPRIVVRSAIPEPSSVVLGLTATVVVYAGLRTRRSQAPTSA
jgi:hypothetical protein